MFKVVKVDQELLPSFAGFFDIITFAVPTFGSRNSEHPAVHNHDLFKQGLAS